MNMLKTLMLLLLLASPSISQILNVDLLSNFKPYANREYSDIWGYVDPQGREYAILGVQHGTSIIDVTNPYQPVEISFIPGPFSTWRDMKTHSHYAYITTEGTGTGQGLQIIDLSQLPNTATLVNTVSTWFSRAHNLYIDNGFAYIVGTNSGGGMHVLDLTDPVNPVRTAYYTGSGYIHDVYVWNDTAYASAEQTYDMISLTNKSAPVKLSVSAALPGIYAHSGWLTEDKRYFIACEEFNVRDITVWDLQDRTWNLIVPQWQMPGNSPVHNVLVKDKFAHISYYKDGYLVLDISDPHNPLKVGQYDTYPGTAGTYAGAWGVYPYLPSGNILISDIQTGLWVFDFLLDDPVPVELRSFSAVVNAMNVELNWETSSETNNRGFNIERSVDKVNWNTLGFVSGYGTSTEIRKYSFTDFNSTPGIYFYRLAQIDFDGTINYHNPVEVNIGAPDNFLVEQNYPNPFNPSTTLRFNLNSDTKVKITIMNSLGEEVSTLVNDYKPAGAHEVKFNASGLSSGMYLAKVEADGNVKTIKMTLLK